MYRLPVLVVFLGLLGKSTARGADLYQYLPADTNAILTLHAEKTRNTPLFKKVTPTLPTGLDENFALWQLLGVHPLKDISGVLIAFPTVGDLNNGFMVVAGKFDAAAIQKRTEGVFKGQVKVHSSGTHTLYELSLGAASTLGVPLPKETFLTLVDANTCLVSLGSKERLVTGLGQKKRMFSQELQGLLTRAHASECLSLVMLPVLARDLEKAIELGAIVGLDRLLAAFKDMRSLSVGVIVQNDVFIQALIAARTAQAARAFGVQSQQILTTTIAGLTLGALQNRELLPLLRIAQSVQINLRSNTVSVRLKIAQADVQGLLK